MLSSMEADRVRLSDLEARIMDLERSLSILRTEQVLVQERLDAYKYPVLTLPNELTSQIFLSFLPIYPAAPPLTGLASPTSLTHICRHWREVALTTPALWRAIEFVYNDDDIMPYEQCRYICDAWITRSRSCPLSIYMDIDDDDGVFPEALTMAAARWEHLMLHAPASFIPKLAGPMPMLRSLDLSSFTMGSNVFVFYEVPQLRTVVLTSIVSSTVTLPWVQLTCLTLNYVGANRCIQILAKTLNLVKCELIVTHEADNLINLDLALPCLESLSLCTYYPVFLHYFIVPSLCRLELDERLLGAEPISTLRSFISRSGCRLQEVCIIRDSLGTRKSLRQAFPPISFTARPV
ncbi:hypothetical protein B0H12DRAFT_277083 [Mycena haematopus]|nr:hypothetical protein B0H12DRAFT_277083 [Mycena haematopus]